MCFYYSSLKSKSLKVTVRQHVINMSFQSLSCAWLCTTLTTARLWIVHLHPLSLSVFIVSLFLPLFQASMCVSPANKLFLSLLLLHFPCLKFHLDPSRLRLQHPFLLSFPLRNLLLFSPFSNMHSERVKTGIFNGKFSLSCWPAKTCHHFVEVCFLLGLPLPLWKHWFLS